MNCINLKQKLDRTLHCKQKKCTIKLSECINCPYKEYKNQVSKIKKRTKKLDKLERERFSLFCGDSKCMLCGSTYQLTWNEIFRGKNRKLSMQYGLCQRLCLDCHRKFQDDVLFNEKWHKKGQIAFEKAYPNLDFIKIFGRNYKDV